MPEEKYVSNVYKTLKENYPNEFTTKPEVFEKAMASDTAYAKNVYGQLKELYPEDFKTTEENFIKAVGTKQVDPYAPKPVNFGKTTSVSPIVPEQPKQRDFTQLKNLQAQNEKWTKEKKVMAAHIDNMKESLAYTNPNQQSMFGETTGSNKAEVASYVESLDQMTTSVKENNDKQIAILTKVFDKDIKPNYKEYVGKAGYGGIEVPNAGKVQEYTDNLMKEMGVDNADDNKRDFIKNAANQYIASLNTYERITPKAEHIFKQNTGKSIKEAMDEEQEKLYAPIIEIDNQYKAQSKMLPKIVDAQYKDEMAQIGVDAEHLNKQIEMESAQVDQHFAEMGKKLQAASVNMNQQQYDAAVNILNQQYKEAKAEKYDNYTMAFGAVVAQEAKINNQRKTDYDKQNQLNYNAYVKKRDAEVAKLSKNKNYSKEFTAQYEKAYNEAYDLYNSLLVKKLNKNQDEDNVAHIIGINAMKSMATSLNNLAKSLGARDFSDGLEKFISGVQLSPKQIGDALEDPETFKNSTGLLDDIEINLKVTASDLFSKTGAATAGQISGSGALGMAMAAGSAYMGNALGVSEGLTMAAGGLISWAQETHDIKKSIYNQVYANTNDVQLAEQASDIAFQSQLLIGGLNVFQMAKFMPDATILTNLVKNPIARKGAVLLTEQVSQTLEEFGQGGVENAMTDPLTAYQQKTLNDAYKYYTFKLLKQTTMTTLPIGGQSAVITFASGAGKGLGDIQKYRADKLQQMRADALLSRQIAEMGDNFGAQQLTQFYDVQGGAQTITSITQLQAKGKITAEKATELIGALLNHDRHNLEAKKLSLQGSNLYAYTGLRQKQDEVERDLLTAATEEEKTTLNGRKTFIQGLINELTTKGTADIVLFRYKNGVQLTMTQGEATKLLMQEGAAQHIEDAGVEVVAMGKTQEPIQQLVKEITANRSKQEAQTTSDNQTTTETQKVLVPLNFEEEAIAEEIDNERQYLEQIILSEEKYLAERESKKNGLRKVLDRLSGVTYDAYLKGNQDRLSRLNENPLAYFEKELEDEIKWKEKHPDDANENIIKRLSDIIDRFKNIKNQQSQAEAQSTSDTQTETEQTTSDTQPQTAEQRAAAILAQVKRKPKTEAEALQAELKTVSDQEERTNIGEQITLHETKAQHEGKVKEIADKIVNLSENGKVVENLDKINALAADKKKIEESISDIENQIKTKQNERETKNKGREKASLLKEKTWHDLAKDDRITVNGVGASVSGVNQNMNGAVHSIDFTLDDGTKGVATILGNDILDANGKPLLIKNEVIQSEKAAPAPSEPKTTSDKKQTEPIEEEKNPSLIDYENERVKYNGEVGYIRVDEGGKITFENGTVIKELIGDEKVTPYRIAVKGNNVNINGDNFEIVSVNKDGNDNVVSVSLKNEKGVMITKRDSELALDIAIQQSQEAFNAKNNVTVEEQDKVVKETFNSHFGLSISEITETMPEVVVDAIVLMDNDIVALAPDEIQLMLLEASQWAEGAIKKIEKTDATKAQKKEAIGKLKKFNKDLNKHYGKVDKQKQSKTNDASKGEATKGDGQTQQKEVETTSDNQKPTESGSGGVGGEVKTFDRSDVEDMEFNNDEQNTVQYNYLKVILDKLNIVYDTPTNYDGKYIVAELKDGSTIKIRYADHKETSKSYTIPDINITFNDETTIEDVARDLAQEVFEGNGQLIYDFKTYGVEQTTASAPQAETKVTSDNQTQKGKATSDNQKPTEVTSDKKSIEKVKVKDLEVGDEVVLKGKEGTWKVAKKTKDGVDLSHTTKQGSMFKGADDGDIEGKVVNRSENVTQSESLKETTKAETPTTNTGVEEGSGVGGDVEAKINKVADEYLYHGTGEGAFRRIREEGLTPQGEKYLYFADKEQYAKTYAQRKGNSFGDRVLRVKKSDAYLPDENTTGGDFKIKNKINPNDIEIKHNGKWIPIQEFADENIGIMPISKAVEQSLKETTKEETKVTSDNQQPTTDTKQQIEAFGVSQDMVEPVHTMLSQIFEGLKKAGITAAKTVGEWVGIGKGEQQADALKQIIGEKGASRLANAEMVLSDLNVAKQMEQAGKTPKEIHLATSWEKGVDGLWRFEIPDGKLKVKVKTGTYKVGDIYEGELLKAHPEIADIEVTVELEPGRNLLIFGEGTMTTTKEGDYFKIDLNVATQSKLKSILEHELMHITQFKEGFARGGSYNDVGIKKSFFGQAFDFKAYAKYRKIAGEVEARNVERRSTMTPAERKAKMLLETEDVAREQQIVLVDAINGVQQSVDVIQSEKDAQAQYRIDTWKHVIESLPNLAKQKNRAKATVALVHEIIHPTLWEIFNGAKNGNAVALKHTQTVVQEYLKAHPDVKLSATELTKMMLAHNDKFAKGETSARYRDVQEFIATSWERYHREGAKGFSDAFQKVLDQITEAFKSVYKSLTGQEVSPELRKMFDEILGKDFTQSESLKETTKAETTSDKKSDGEPTSDNVILSEKSDATIKYNNLIKAIEKLKAENPKEFKKDGTPKSNSKILPSYKALADMATQAYEDSYLERQAQRRKEAKVIADKKDTGLVDGMANIASNSNAAQLFKTAMSKGVFNESEYNQIGTELALLPKDKNGQVDIRDVAEIVQSYFDNTVRPEKNEAQKKETEAINKAFEERQAELSKNLTPEQIQEEKEFDEINRIFAKVQSDETPTKKEIDYVNQNAWIPKGFVFGKNGLEEKSTSDNNVKQSEQKVTAVRQNGKTIIDENGNLTDELPNQFEKLKSEKDFKGLNELYSTVRIFLNGVAQSKGEKTVQQFQKLKKDIEDYANEVKEQSTSDNNINPSKPQPDAFDKAADATIAALNKYKILDTKSTDKKMGFGGDGEKIIRAAFDASRVIYHTTKSLAEAIKKALKTVRDSDWYKNLSGDQKSEIDSLVRKQLNDYAKENVVAEPLEELDLDMQDQAVKDQIMIEAQNLITTEDFKDAKEFSLRLKELYGIKETDAKAIYDKLVDFINVQTEDPFKIALRGKGAVTDHMSNKTINESSEDEIGNRTYLANSFDEMNEDIDAVFGRIKAANPNNWEKIIADKILKKLDERDMQAAIFADRFVTYLNTYLADHQRSPNYTAKALEYKGYRREILARRQKFTQEYATYFAALQQLKINNPLTLIKESGMLTAAERQAAKEMDEKLKGKKEYDASGKKKPFVEDSALDKAAPTSDKKGKSTSDKKDKPPTEKQAKKASRSEVKKNVLNALKNIKNNAADLAIKITKIPC